jgi:hypothetical protein
VGGNVANALAHVCMGQGNLLGLAGCAARVQHHRHVLGVYRASSDPLGCGPGVGWSVNTANYPGGGRGCLRHESSPPLASSDSLGCGPGVGWSVNTAVYNSKNVRLVETD